MLDDVGSNVRKFSAKYHSPGNVPKILNILAKCPNLKIFETGNYDEYVKELEVKTLPELKLDAIKTNDRNMLALFTKSSVEKLEIYYRHISCETGGDPVFLRKFLKTHKELKHLVISISSDRGKDFADKAWNPVRFRLETLEISDYAIGDHKTFTTFLRAHEKSLKSFKISGCSSSLIFPIIKKFKGLEKF